MKYILIAILCAMTFSANCQTYKKDAQGNYYSPVKPKQDTKTKYTYTNEKGIVYPIFVSVRGKYYYFKKAKSGNMYKCYLSDGQ